MQSRVFALLSSLGLVLTFFSSTALAQYKLTNLDSNQFGRAQMDDPLIVNAWGMARGAGTPWWVSDQGSGWSTLYNGAGTKVTTLVVSVPAAAGLPVGQPTGIVFNPSTSSEFPIDGHQAAFIFDSLDGTISAWPGASRFAAAIVHDNSANKAPNKPSYTALAVTNYPAGNSLFVVDNANNVVEIYDGTFAFKGTFAADPSIPAGFSAFGIQDILGTVYVTFAANNGGPGGFIDTYKEDGTLIGTFAQGFPLNQPWGLAVAPGNFGPLSSTLLVSNNTNTGTINAFNAKGQFVGALIGTDGNPIVIDQLWSIAFGGGTTSNGAANALYFTAGPHNNLAGTFGMIVPGFGQGNNQQGN